MAYTARTWTNGEGLALSADNLNKIERGIEDCSQDIDDYKKYIEEFLTPKTIWENESPEANFISQEIKIDLTGYKRISILFKYRTFTSKYFEFQHSFKGETIRVSDGRVNDYSNSYSRDVEFLNEGISFSSGMRNSPSSHSYNMDDCMIPVKIIGYKY